MSDSSNKSTLKSIIITASITVIIDVFMVYLGTLKQFQLGWSLGSVGIVTFFGMLIIVSFASKQASIIGIDSIRKAITASFISMYFVFVSVICLEDTNITDVEIVQPVISHFTYLVGLVVAFYFASTSLSEYIKKKTTDSASNQNPQAPFVNNQIQNPQSTSGGST